MKQRYLIFFNDEVFSTDWFDIGNNFVPGMIAVDVYLGFLFNSTCEDGKWKPLTEDHL